MLLQAGKASSPEDVEAAKLQGLGIAGMLIDTPAQWTNLWYDNSCFSNRFRSSKAMYAEVVLMFQSFCAHIWRSTALVPALRCPFDMIFQTDHARPACNTFLICFTLSVACTAFMPSAPLHTLLLALSQPHGCVQVPRLEWQQAHIHSTLGIAACPAHPFTVRQLYQQPGRLCTRCLVMLGDSGRQLQRSAARQLAPAGADTSAETVGCVRCFCTGTAYHMTWSPHPLPCALVATGDHHAPMH